jgi:glycosyltransferase involved in cell wall biosynthesis
LRIALVTSLPRGGPVEHAILLARELRRLGHEVRAVCATGALAERFGDAVELPLRPGADLAGAAALRSFLRGFDVVHAHDRRSALWTRLLPRPPVLVQTVHGLPDPYLPSGRPGWRDVLAYRGLDAKLAHRCDAVITPTAFMREQLVRRLGYPPVEVVWNGVEVPDEPLAGGEAVGTLSVLEPVKDIDTFLDAAALFDAPIRVYGAGSEAERLSRRVELQGHVPAAEALRSLRVLVISSVMENAPMSMLEAMAAGVPVVATTVGGIPELAPPGTAILVPPRDPRALADGVRRLLDDPGLARAQAARAREHVRAHLSAEGMARHVEAIYERCAS